MRILFLVHAFNSLSQRLYVELARRGHELSVEFDINDTITAEAVALFRPDLILAPFLKRPIPEAVWRHHLCWVVHPGPRGDRGPSSLDWAVLEGARHWGVTVLQAEREMDSGPVWASVDCPLRAAAKGSLYRREVSEAAVTAVLEALDNLARPGFAPLPLATRPGHGLLRPAVRHADRALDWGRDDTATLLRKIRCADGAPGVRDRWQGRELYLYDAWPANGMQGYPGELLATHNGALCRATIDGAIWIGRLRERRDERQGLKLPAATVLGEAAARLPEAPPGCGYREIHYQEESGVGYLHFDFHNGAMGSEQCHRLLAAYEEALARDTRVLVLMGGEEFWSNGLHLHLIEAAANPGDASWENINAMDDLCRAIILTTDRLVVAALRGNAGAGGVFLALAADHVWAAPGVVFNPHYKNMGNLYGSEYWSYLLPRRLGSAGADALMQHRLPLGAAEAKGCGLIDDTFGADRDGFERELKQRAVALAQAADHTAQLAAKRAQRADDEAQKPLDDYRREELEQMRLNFYGFDPSYHIARYNFVRRIPHSRTPLHLARHRSKG
ncbi:MAG: hydrogenase maturation protein [Gammaproteobacteria bacterium]|nr:hydrogenase maturation protein [Gammaproteobacteria bacterium]